MTELSLCRSASVNPCPRMHPPIVPSPGQETCQPECPPW